MQQDSTRLQPVEQNDSSIVAGSEGHVVSLAAVLLVKVSKCPPDSKALLFCGGPYHNSSD